MPTDAEPELPPVVAFTELQELLGLGRTRTNQLIRFDVSFPPPIATLAVGKIWSTPDVVAYCRREGRAVHPIGSPGSGK